MPMTSGYLVYDDNQDSRDVIGTKPTYHFEGYILLSIVKHPMDANVPPLPKILAHYQLCEFS